MQTKSFEYLAQYSKMFQQGVQEGDAKLQECYNYFSSLLCIMYSYLFSCLIMEHVL
jgi:hypothetical protein